MRCTHCGSSNFDEDRARADLVCLDCGMVLSENAISSTVEFVETAGGASAAVGRFVSDESQLVGRESRQVTENKARKRIDTICGHLRLGSDVATSAFRYYQSALFRGITRGRGALHVAAACVYLAARQLRVNLMLLDLSDAVAVNVYALGHCYSDLRRRLHLVIPEMDPCLYIERFASQLEFGDKMPLVATTAMRLLQRMKKDWISTGRRPSGLAAAALLVAARIHEFNRNEEDVSRIARISQHTARKRLEEFARTPTSALSIDDFFAVDYEEEQDPPAFLASKKSDEAIKEMDEVAFSKITAEISELERRIDVELQALAEKRSCRKFLGKLEDFGSSKGVEHLLEDSSRTSDPSSETANESESTNSSKPTRNVLREVLDGLVDPALLDSCVEDLHILTQHSGEKVCELLEQVEESRLLDDLNSAQNDSAETPTEDSGEHKPDDQKPKKLPLFLACPREAKVEYPGGDDGVLCLDDIDDDELDQEYLLRPREVMIKAAIWYKSNADYLQSARRKRLAKLQQMEQEAKGHNKKRSRKQSSQRKPRSMTKYDGHEKFEPPSEESQDQPMSSKINYEALEALVGASAPSAVQSDPPPLISVDTAPGPLLASTLSMKQTVPTVDSDEKQPSASILSSSASEKAFVTKKVVQFSDPPTQPSVAPQQPSTSNEEPVSLDLEDQGEEEEDDELDLDRPLEEFYRDEVDDDEWEQGAELW